MSAATTPGQVPQDLSGFFFRGDDPHWLQEAGRPAGPWHVGGLLNPETGAWFAFCGEYMPDPVVVVTTNPDAWPAPRCMACQQDPPAAKLA